MKEGYILVAEDDKRTAATTLPLIRENTRFTNIIRAEDTFEARVKILNISKIFLIVSDLYFENEKKSSKDYFNEIVSRSLINLNKNIFNISSNKGIPVYIYSKYIEYPGFQNYDEDDYVKFDDIYEIINKNKKLYNSSNNFKNNFWDDILTKEIKSAELIITDAFKKMGAKDCYGKTSIVKGPEQLIEVIKENYLKE